jgi:hypothetical protein
MPSFRRNRLVLGTPVETTPSWRFIGGTFGQMFAGFAIFLIILMARSAFQPNASTVLKADSRKPVLLMRSFVDDERMSEFLVWSFIDRCIMDDEMFSNRSENTFFDFSLESRLASHFRHYGPFIAVGAPSNWIPVIGAGDREP